MPQCRVYFSVTTVEALTARGPKEIGVVKNGVSEQLAGTPAAGPNGMVGSAITAPVAEVASPLTGPQGPGSRSGPVAGAGWAPTQSLSLSTPSSLSTPGRKPVGMSTSVSPSVSIPP